MSETLVFYPPRRRGLILHAALIAALAAASALAFVLGLRQPGGNAFTLLLLLSLLFFAPLPFLLYRAYALARAGYRLERDGLRLRWGLRAEDIPLPQIEWVRRAVDLAADLPLPPLALPGALLGTAHTADLGVVEYLAAETSTLVLIATPQRVYAISPEDPQAFLRSFQRTLELGSLSPLSSMSVLPAAYLSQIWADRAARWLLLSGFGLALALFAIVSLAIPARAGASLGFYPDGSPLPPGPAAQLMLLPILGVFFFIADLTAGLFFYRRAGAPGSAARVMAYIAWGSAVVCALLLIAAVLFIFARTPA